MQTARHPDEPRKKQRLRSDLADFDIQVLRVGLAMTNFLKNLQAVEGAWVQMNSSMLVIGNSITGNNVGALPFLVEARSRLAVDGWKSVRDSARQFTAGSLIDYASLAFGDRMPESQAAQQGA
jgi:hypothetical protein